MKQGIFHPTIKLSNEVDSEIETKEMPLLAVSTTTAYQFHLLQCWPQLENFVEIGFVKGTRFKEFCISCDLDSENEDWNEFLFIGIVLPKAIENLKKIGVQKILIFCENEIKVWEIDELVKQKIYLGYPH